MQECFYYNSFKMDVAIIDSIIQEQINTDYNEGMREDNYEVVKVHFTDIISKIVDGSHRCTCNLLITHGYPCRHFYKILRCSTQAKWHIGLIASRWFCHGFISDKQAILESGQNMEEIDFNIKNPIITAKKGRPAGRAKSCVEIQD
ncbi:unnamed protein product [Rhizophagus irregularis]|nr:unnamed protein product [Rhizophagus irregularis]